MASITLGSVILLLLITGILFLNLSPEFGGTPNKTQKALYRNSSNYAAGKFSNINGVKMSMKFSQMPGLIKKFFQAQPFSVPEGALPLIKSDSLSIAQYHFEKPRIIWFGHSAVLLQIAGKNILIDPMFGPVPAPHPWLGTPRFQNELPIEIEKLPQIDAVVLSHDHYDHLDYGSIVQLKNKVKAFYTPLGVGNHLIKWGVEKERITELDWWEETQHEDLRLICTPAQHFSGRGLFDRGNTLWSSWIIQSSSDNIFFSGDSGYGNHFKEIGAKYGPFDFAMMECGQYNELWIEIHMLPEQTAQAAQDLQAELFMPIHWGAFKLALHTWTDPVDRVFSKSTELGVPLTTPRIGEPIILNQQKPPASKWWTNL